MSISWAQRRMKQSVLYAIIVGIFVFGAVVVGAGYLLVDELREQPQTAAVAAPAQQGVAVGRTFPRFGLTEVAGRRLSNDTLAGKPSLLWFMTSWCVPCQVGARKIAELDTSLGGNTFEVVVVFVDHNDEPADLIEWRDRFANGDWMVAFDNPSDSVTRKVNLRYLDSKYLLDQDGIVQNIDFQIAGDDYLDTIRLVVRGS